MCRTKTKDDIEDIVHNRTKRRYRKQCAQQDQEKR